MSFADPSITVAGSTVALPRTGSSLSSGVFTSADGVYTMTVSHNYGKRTRRTVRLTKNVISADPLLPNVNVRTNASVYIVVDHPVNGIAQADVKAMGDALVAYLSASSGAKITQLMGGES